MEIKIEKENNNVDALLTVNIKLADIEEEVNKQLHQTKQKLNLPGFRPGKIPLEIAKKYLWEGIIKQELEKKLESSIEEYFKNNQIEIFKPLLPVHQEIEIDFKNFTENNFNYNIGLIENLTDDSLNYLTEIHQYSIKVTKKDIDEELDYIRHSYGQHTHPEEIEDSDYINMTISLIELNHNQEPLEGGVNQTLKKDLKKLPVALRKGLIGKKQNEEIIFNISGLFKTTKDLGDFLNIDQNTAEDLSNDLKIKIISIHKEEPVELNEELFIKYSGGKAKTKEEFQTYVEDLVTKSYERQADNFLTDQIFESLLEKFEINLPVKYFELLFNEEYRDKMKEMNSEQIKIEKSEFDKKMKWSLIAEQLTKKFDIQVTENEIVQEAYIYLYSYFYQYGIQNTPEDQMVKYVTEYLKNEENLNRTRSQVITKKLFDEIKKTIVFSKKEINTDKFKKLKTEK